MVDFSVIMPCYNSSKYIRQAIESVLYQLDAGVEIIVVDDGSTDDTKLVLDDYILNNVIRYYYINNVGPAGARNYGIRKSTGKYIIFCDSDDLFNINCLCEIKIALEKYPSAGIAFGNYEIFLNSEVLSKSGVDNWKRFRNIPKQYLGEGVFLFEERLTKYILEMGGFYCVSGFAIRKNVMDLDNLFRDGFFYGEDDEFFARIAYECDALFIDKILTKRRNHPESISHDCDVNKRTRNIKSILNITNIQLKYYSGDPYIKKILTKKVYMLAKEYLWALEKQGLYSESVSLLKSFDFGGRISYLKLILKNRVKYLLYKYRCRFWS